MNYELLQVPSVALLELLAAAAWTWVVAAWQVLATDGLCRLTVARVASCCLLLPGISKFSA